MRTVLDEALDAEVEESHAKRDDANDQASGRDKNLWL